MVLSAEVPTAKKSNDFRLNSASIAIAVHEVESRVFRNASPLHGGPRDYVHTNQIQDKNSSSTHYRVIQGSASLLSTDRNSSLYYLANRKFVIYNQILRSRSPCGIQVS